jgi:hypothetical protein
VTDLSTRLRAAAALALLSVPLALPAQDTGSGENCTFRTDPDAYLQRGKRTRENTAKTVAAFAKSRTAAAVSATALVDPGSIPRRNFVDEAIFNAMSKAGVQSAPLATDAEFVRRIYLDLTGRIPSPAEVRRFLSDPDTESRRSRLIGELLYSEAFTDKWTWWMDEWVANRSQSPSGAYRSIQAQGRNALHKFLWSGVASGRPIRDIAEELIGARGNNYEEATGASSFMVMAYTANGPVEDTYDTMMVRTASTFWGISHYDCLMCHGGRAHLEPMSLWAIGVSRLQAQQMAAFFSRTSQVPYALPPGLTPEQQRAFFYTNSYDVQDLQARGGYSMRTTYGNRPRRNPIGSVTALTPEFTFSHGAKPAGNDWRQELAKHVVNEPMFARNIANRLWKQVFNLGLVDPVDSMDPARLDPTKPPAAETGWGLQATHPELLENLAGWLRANDFNLREFLRLLTESSAYQLSSEYPGTEWRADMVPLFARHYVRRLEAEEIHDALAKSTGIIPSYTVQHWGEPMRWAMQLPDTSEPPSNTAPGAFMNLFNRGNRETQPRQANSTTLQQLVLMNDAYVVDKIKVANSPAMKEIVKLTTSDAVAEELYLTFLSRFPTTEEKGKVAAHIAKAPNANQRNAYIEDVAWALVNKIDFLFSY